MTLLPSWDDGAGNFAHGSHPVNAAREQKKTTALPSSSSATGRELKTLKPLETIGPDRIHRFLLDYLQSALPRLICGQIVSPL